MRLRDLVAQTRYSLSAGTKFYRRSIKHFAKNPALALAIFAYRRAYLRLNWRQAYERAMTIVPMVEKSGDRLLLHEFGFAMLRFQEDEIGYRLLLKHRGLTSDPLPKPWSGEDLSGKTLLINTMVTEKQGLAVGINAVGNIGSAAALCGKCILICHPRLQALFQRSFPQIDVRVFSPTLNYDEADFVADNLDLAYYFAKHPEKVKLLALKAGSETTRTMRERYRAGREKPLIGIAWLSVHKGKETPPLEAWKKLVADERYLFVSLQYGNITNEAAEFRAVAGDRFIVDETVDQLVDMDRFAAQVGAMDAIVSISNTGAHLANAMDAKLVLLRDDQFGRNWPVLSGRVPAFPNVLVIGKNGRSWDDVIADALRVLPEVLR
jgi:hypothetical protein